MNKKLFIPVMLAMVLAFGMTVLGCGDEDEWSDVTSLKQINGTWKGTFNQNQSFADGAKMTSKTNMTLTIVASDKTIESSQITTINFSGIDNDTWEMLKWSLESDLEEGMTVTFDDAAHSANMELNTPAETMSDAEIKQMLRYLQISQDGKKLKVSANGTEMILTKQ
jgi:hypothetical protein